MNFAQTSLTPLILDALQALYTTELITNVTDDLRLVTLKPAPLQDDPTRVAPFLVYAPAPELGRQPVTNPEQGGFGIGAHELWRVHFKGLCGTPQVGSREEAYAAIEELASRVEVATLKHYALNDVLAPGQLASADGSQWIDAANPAHTWTRSVPLIFGGGTQWFGRCVLVWNYTVARFASWRR